MSIKAWSHHSELRCRILVGAGSRACPDIVHADGMWDAMFSIRAGSEPSLTMPEPGRPCGMEVNKVDQVAS
jgi:hypothetical protein